MWKCCFTNICFSVNGRFPFTFRLFSVTTAGGAEGAGRLVGS